LKTHHETLLRNAQEERSIALTMNKPDRVPMLDTRISALKRIIHLQEELAHDDGKHELWLKHKIGLLEKELEGT
jgi:hypothetical protein